MNDKTRKNRIYRAMIMIRKTDYCWFWTGRVNKSGYGLFNIGIASMAHRAIWILLRGPIPEGMELLHQCDNKRCVNPNHMAVGTHAKNMKEASDRGRFPSRAGALNPRSKVTENDVMTIRADVDSTNVALAEKYRISDVAISNIRARKTWAHVA